MSEIKLSDFVGRRLKDLYHVSTKERLKSNEYDEDALLVLEFDNNHKIMLRGVGKPGFLIKKDRIEELSDENKKILEEEKKAALKERHDKEAKQKNRPKSKKAGK